MIGFFYGPIFYIPISMVILIGLGMYGLRRRLPKPYYLCMGIGLVYINFAISLTFFPMTFLELEGFAIENNISWSLLHSSQGLKHALMNIILTIPLAMGIQFITNLNNKRRFIVVMLLSAFPELLQLIILYAFRPIDMFFDVNDLVCNVGGGLVGYILIGIVNYTCKDIKCEEKRGIIAYLLNVCYRCANGKSSLM